jgi:hypothetical protein
MQNATATATTPATVTARELKVLRFAPKAGDLTLPVLGSHYDPEAEALAARGLLDIRSRRSWGISYNLTPAGLAAVWDNAPASIAHLRPAGV